MAEQSKGDTSKVKPVHVDPKDQDDLYRRTKEEVDRKQEGDKK